MWLKAFDDEGQRLNGGCREESGDGPVGFFLAGFGWKNFVFSLGVFGFLKFE